jgi:hypothetical protein
LSEIVVGFLKVLPWIIALCLAFMFRKPLAMLIERLSDVCKRVADTKRISKTRDGLTAEFGDWAVVAVSEQRTQDIELLSEGGQAVGTAEQGEENNWIISFINDDYENAIRQLDEEIGEGGKYTDFEVFRALCYYRKNGFLEGVREFETVIGKYPTG